MSLSLLLFESYVTQTLIIVTSSCSDQLFFFSIYVFSRGVFSPFLRHKLGLLLLKNWHLEMCFC